MSADDYILIVLHSALGLSMGWYLLDVVLIDQLPSEGRVKPIIRKWIESRESFQGTSEFLFIVCALIIYFIPMLIIFFAFVENLVLEFKEKLITYWGVFWFVGLFLRVFWERWLRRTKDKI